MKFAWWADLQWLEKQGWAHNTWSVKRKAKLTFISYILSCEPCLRHRSTLAVDKEAIYQLKAPRMARGGGTSHWFPWLEVTCRGLSGRQFETLQKLVRSWTLPPRLWSLKGKSFQWDKWRVCVSVNCLRLGVYLKLTLVIRAGILNFVC